MKWPVIGCSSHQLHWVFFLDNWRRNEWLTHWHGCIKTLASNSFSSLPWSWCDLILIHPSSSLLFSFYTVVNKCLQRYYVAQALSFHLAWCLMYEIFPVRLVVQIFLMGVCPLEYETYISSSHLVNNCPSPHWCIFDTAICDTASNMSKKHVFNNSTTTIRMYVAKINLVLHNFYIDQAVCYLHFCW